MLLSKCYAFVTDVHDKRIDEARKRLGTSSTLQLTELSPQSSGMFLSNQMYPDHQNVSKGRVTSLAKARV